MTTAAITPTAAAGSPARITEFARIVAFRVANLLRAYKNRRAMQSLASLDDRMLADIGLTRGDVRDAFSQPAWADPSRVLVNRWRERRYARRPTVLGIQHVQAPPTVPEVGGLGAGSRIHVRYY